MSRSCSLLLSLIDFLHFDLPRLRLSRLCGLWLPFRTHQLACEVHERLSGDKQGECGDRAACCDGALANRVDSVFGNVRSLRFGRFPRISGKMARLQPLLKVLAEID